MSQLHGKHKSSSGKYEWVPLNVVKNEDGTYTLKVDTGLIRDKYVSADSDEASDPKYYGFNDIDGKWYIKEVNVAAGTTRFAAGDTDYPTNWTGRGGLGYDYFYNAF